MKNFHIDTWSHHRTNWSRANTIEKYIAGDKINPTYTNWNNSTTRVGKEITGKGIYKSISAMLRELAFENLRARAYSMPHQEQAAYGYMDRKDLLDIG